MNKIVLLVLLAAATPASAADIYQWTDENGKVHFSDKPPRDKAAENITDTTKHINVDSSARERNKISEIFAPPTIEEQQYQQQQAAEQKHQQLAKQNYCDKLNKELSFFKTERFYWVDDEGNSSYATEAERRELIGKLEKALKENC